MSDQNNSITSNSDPTKVSQVEVANQSWHQQRQQLRDRHHQHVREVEELPEVGPDGRYVVGGKSYGMAVGRVKGAGAGMAIEDALVAGLAAALTSGIVFEDDNDELKRELADLDRDAELVARSEQVKHDLRMDAITRTYRPEMPDEALEDEGKFNEWMQNHIQEGDKK